MTVDQQLYDHYATEIDSFAATEGNTLLVVPGMCDADRNAICNVSDVETMSQKVQVGEEPMFMLDDLIRRPMPSGFNTYYGDANLDGEFNSSDLVAVFAEGLYETGQPGGWRLDRRRVVRHR